MVDLDHGGVLSAYAVAERARAFEARARGGRLVRATSLVPVAVSAGGDHPDACEVPGCCAGRVPAWLEARARARRSLRRGLVILAAVLGLFAVAVAAGGCAEIGLANDQAEAADRQAALDAQIDRLGVLLQQYRQAVGAGVDPAEAVAVLRVGLGSGIEAEVLSVIEQAIAAGVPVPEAAEAARRGLEVAVSEIAGYRAELAKLREQAREADEGWFGLADVAIGVLGGLVPGLAGAGVAVVGGVRKARQARLDGKRLGAEAVRDSVRAGREADPEFDRFFESNTPAAAVMRATLDAMPDVAAIVRANNAQRPRRPEGMKR